MILCLGVLEAKKQVGGGRRDSHDGHCGKRRAYRPHDFSTPLYLHQTATL